MKFSKILSPLLLIIPFTLALPTTPINTLLIPRQSCAETCGTVCYYQTTINRAVSEGYELYQAGEKDGSSSYPHTYNNYEGFSFPVTGPYQEFPIMNDFQEYDGGAPGPDRVIFNTRGQLAGVITHTGASGNNFVECRG